MNGLLIVPCATAAPLLAGAAASSKRRATILDRISIASRSPYSRESRDLSRLLPFVAPLVLVSGWMTAGPPGALTGAAFAVVLPAAIRRRKRARVTQLLDRQLTDAVRALAAGIRSGMSLPQAIANAAGEIGDPLSSSMHALADLHSLGEPLADALSGWASSIGTPDSRFVAGVLRLHQRTGGDLPFVLDRVARTLSDRADAEREVRTLTAQARLSGAILGALPVGFFLFLSLVARSDVAAAYDSAAGASAVIAGLILQGLAYLWIRHLLEVEA